MRFVVVLCCLLFAVRVSADNAYYEGSLPFKLSAEWRHEVRNEEGTARVLFTIRGDVFEFTIFAPPDENGDEQNFVVRVRRDLLVKQAIKVYTGDGEHLIGGGEEVADGRFQLEFGYMMMGTKVADAEVELGFDEDSAGVDLKFKMTFTLVKYSIEVEGHLPAADKKQ